MTSFGWKRKAGQNICKSTAENFNSQAKDDEADNVNDVADWLTSAPKRRAISLEDALSKSERLKAEGAMLAEAERYWEAMKKWDEALQLTPQNEKIVEMKAQALMAVGEVFPAVQTAERTVKLAPTWWVAHQTLGRALVNIGEVNMALRSFSRAVHLNPSDRELWVDDLLWTRSLLDRKKMAAEASDVPASTLTVTELRSDESDDDSSEEEDLSDKTVIKYSGGGERSQGENVARNLKRVPRNYVQMRDPT